MMNAEIKRLYRERTSLRTILVVLGVFVIGVICLVLAQSVQWPPKSLWLQSVIRELGGLLIASVAIGFLWKLVAKRAFSDELFAQVKLAEEVRSAGLVSVLGDFIRDVDWRSLFGRVNKLDIYFSYGQTWRNTNREQLRAVAGRNNVWVRVVLPDPEDEAVVNELARRFNTDANDVKTKINGAVSDFKTIFATPSQEGRVNFSLHLLPYSPVFSLYRFDYLYVLALFKHRQSLETVPTFILEEGGTLAKFLLEAVQERITSQRQVGTD